MSEPPLPTDPAPSGSGTAPRRQQPGSVLFICNHNIIRSPMAEALLKAKVGKRIYVASAGVHAGTPDPFVETVMQERGIDVQNRTPKTLAELEDTFFDLIVSLSPTAHHVALEEALISAEDIVYWPAGDPTVVQGSREQILDAYREVRDRIGARIDSHFD